MYYFWNDAHQIFLDEYFMPTFNKHHNPDEINLIGKKINSVTENCLFGTFEYKQLLTERIGYLIDLIEGVEKGKFFIFCDVDVQFFGSIKPAISLMMKGDFDIVFQKEDKRAKNVNFGVMLIQANDSSLNFYKEIYKRLTSPTCPVGSNDQLEGNQLLHMIDYSTFDKTIWNWSQGELNKEVILHHANCVSNIKKKIEQLEEVKRFVLN